ncbi:MAG: SDR family oxidoreductase [Pseudomonadota bacterium]
MRLQGRKALVTGAAGGIGAAIVRKLQAEGAVVCGTDRETSGIVADFAIAAELMDGSACDELPARAEALMGGLDTVINNAGIITRGKLTEATDEDFARSMAINVEAPMRICRAAIPILPPGSSIVNTASCWGVHPGPNHPIYVMSKAAIASLTQCLGIDHAADGIRVNAVCPNEVNTPMLRTGFATRGLDPDQAIETLNTSVPLGRIAEPEDIADVVAFLASDEARYICGALIEVNGAKAVS